jgi:hypothetical protein
LDVFTTSAVQEYAAIRRTNTPVRGVARHLGVRAPATLDLNQMLAILRQIEKSPRNATLRRALEREQRRLRNVLGPPRALPWSQLGTASGSGQR